MRLHFHHMFRPFCCWSWLLIWIRLNGTKYKQTISLDLLLYELLQVPPSFGKVDWGH